MQNNTYTDTDYEQIIDDQLDRLCENDEISVDEYLFSTENLDWIYELLSDGVSLQRAVKTIYEFQCLL